VGKSTVAVNLALGFAAAGLRAGVLDADLYGPSVPRLLGLEGRTAVRQDGIFQPHEAYGLKVMSIGPMLTPNQAVVWRGPMATSALRQLLRESEWGSLDVLVVDLPPGTGDIQISLVQQVPLTGAVIVSTPQDLALIDAQKAIDMLKRTGVPLLGLVENMSYFVAPDTGARYDIFGHGGAQAAALKLGIPFLGEIPLVMKIRETSDAGTPVVALETNGPEAQAFRAIATALLAAHPALKS
jgi:ATP-binding protein involved in chromosome partitioning